MITTVVRGCAHSMFVPKCIHVKASISFEATHTWNATTLCSRYLS